MAGRGPRTYGRKKAAHPLSQFDRLISEASNKGSHHPVAAKTAGHVGKWGMTSFTSIRSINGALSTAGKEDTLKRGSSSEECDPFGFEPDSKSEMKAACPVVKRRKFFKSRDVGVVSTSANDSNSNVSSFPDIISDYGALNKVNSKVTTASENSLNQKRNKDCSVKSTNVASGGIKLKIFKSRNTGTDLHSPEIYSSSIQLSSDDASNSSLSSTGSSTANPGTSTVNISSNGETSVIDDPTTLSNISETTTEQSGIIDTTVTKLCINRSFDSNSGSSSESKFSSIDAPNPLRDTSIPLYSISEDIKKCSVVNSEPTNCVEQPESVNFGIENSKNEVPIDLFSSDFDENEIVDRTSIDDISTELSSYTSVEPDKCQSKCSVNKTNCETENVARNDPVFYSNSDSSGFLSDLPALTLSRANTLNLNDLEASGSNSLSKSLSESDTTSLSKKRSIFKSRQKDDEPKKRATYTHKWHGHEERDKKETLQSSVTHTDDPFGFDGSLTKVPTKALSTYKSGYTFDEEDALGTSIKCPKQAKKVLSSTGTVPY